MLNKRLLYRVSFVLSMILFLFFLWEVIYSNNNFSPKEFYLKKFQQYKRDPAITYFLSNKLLDFSHDDADSRMMHYIMHDIFKYQEHSNVGHYQMLLGIIAYQNDNPILATFHFKRVLYDRNNIDNESMVYEALRYLVSLETDAYQRIFYINMMLEQYRNNIESSGNVYYALGKAYDEVGNFYRAYKAYERFLTFPVESLHAEARYQRADIFKRVQRYKYASTHTEYTWDTPEKARAAVRKAFYYSNRDLINQLQSPNFFAMQWHEEMTDPNAFIPTFNIAAVLSRSSISFSDEFSPFSTENEKLWKTVGWERLSTWYFAFRRISQPDRADINGKWEWAGIYFGIGSKMYVP